MPSATRPSASGRVLRRGRPGPTLVGRAALLVGVVFLGAAACGGTAAAHGSTPVPSSDGAPDGHATGSAAGTYRLVTEPDDGMSPIYRLIGSARRSIDMTMYELADPTAEADLVAAARRGVKVRVVLDQNRERSNNTPAFDELAAHGVEVRWAPTSYDATHEKAIVVDDEIAAIMTLNLVREDYAGTRDFAVIDRSHADVAAIEAVFSHDVAGDRTSPLPKGSDLVWSPGADAPLVALIDSARHRCLVENEELSEYTIVDALAAAAHRGVDVELVMTYQSTWQANLDKLAAAGVHVRTYAEDAARYVHAKVIDVDPSTSGERLFIGSQNFSWASLQYNRELGLVLGPGEPGISTSVTGTIQRDYAGARPWKG